MIGSNYHVIYFSQSQLLLAKANEEVVLKKSTGFRNPMLSLVFYFVPFRKSDCSLKRVKKRLNILYNGAYWNPQNHNVPVCTKFREEKNSRKNIFYYYSPRGISYKLKHICIYIQTYMYIHTNIYVYTYKHIQIMHNALLCIRLLWMQSESHRKCPSKDKGNDIKLINGTDRPIIISSRYKVRLG